MPKWYVRIDGQKQGPFETIKVTSMLRLGTLKSDDLVWYEGMDEWTPAGQVPEITGRAKDLPAQSFGALSPAAARMISPASVIEDEGPFHRIGNQFRVLGRGWSGPVVVSPKAFYLLKVSRVGGPQAGVAGAHGMVAGALTGAASALWSAAIEIPEDTRTCGLADLPLQVRRELDPDQKSPSRDVIVIKQEAVSLVSVPRVNNAITLHVGGYKVWIAIRLFGAGQVSRKLDELGWTPNSARDPSEMPSFGQGFGRPADAAKPEDLSVLTRVLYAVLALVLAAVAVVLWFYLRTAGRP